MSVLLGEAPHQVLNRHVSLKSQSTPVGLRMQTRRMYSLSTTTKWRICDVNSQLTWKPMWTPPFKIFFFQHSQLFNNVYVFSLPYQHSEFSKLYISDTPECPS